MANISALYKERKNQQPINEVDLSLFLNDVFKSGKFEIPFDMIYKDNITNTPIISVKSLFNLYNLWSKRNEKENVIKFNDFYNEILC